MEGSSPRHQWWCPALRQQQGMALTTQPHSRPGEVGLRNPLPEILPEMAREAEG